MCDILVMVISLLYYTEIGLSPYEVPGYMSICIYISGCCNLCENCQYPMLKQNDYGDKLLENFQKIIQLYQEKANSICFLGEGKNSPYEHREFYKMIEIAKKYNLKTCLYCGRDATVEKWMRIFDFVKLGSYQETFGGLNKKTTNQRFLQKTKKGYIDITHKFWGNVL